MEDDEVVMAYRVHVPDDPFAVTVEQHMCNWLDSNVANFTAEQRGDRIKAGPKKSGWEVLQYDPTIDYDDEWLMEPLDLTHLRKKKILKSDRSDMARGKQERIKKISRDYETQDAPTRIPIVLSDSESDASRLDGSRGLDVDDKGSSSDEIPRCDDAVSKGDDSSSCDNDGFRGANDGSGSDSDGSSSDNDDPGSDDDGSSSDDDSVQEKRDGSNATASKMVHKNLDFDWPSDDEDEPAIISQDFEEIGVDVAGTALQSWYISHLNRGTSSKSAIL